MKMKKYILLALAFLTLNSAYAADLKISQMNAVGTASGSECMHAAKSGADYKICLTDISSYILGQTTGITFPLSAAKGGTGAATLTQYAVLLGNGTGALQGVSGLGTSGQVLTSNGAGSAPTWQDAAGGGGTTLPSQTGNSGKYLTTDGSSLSWGTVSGVGDVTAASSFGTDNILVRSDGTGKGVQSSGISVDDSNNVSGVGTLATGAQTITSNSATAVTIGPNGATNPVVTVVASTASQASGVYFQGSAAGSAPIIGVTSSGTNESLDIRPKGTGDVTVGSLSSSGDVKIRANNGTKVTFGPTTTTYTPGTASGAATTRFLYTAAADTLLTGGTEATVVNFNLSATRQHGSNTTVTLQRDMRIQGTNHTFQTSGGTITDVATLSPEYGNVSTNGTGTNLSALYVPTAALTNVTNAYGLNIAAASGATNNYAAKLTGRTWLNGGVQFAIRVVTAAGDITVATTDYTIVVNKTSGAATNVTLPTCNSANAGQLFIVKDGKKDAATNNITVLGTIDGGTNDTISTNGASVRYQCDGSSYWKL